jgi:hypothetical protein
VSEVKNNQNQNNSNLNISHVSINSQNQIKSQKSTSNISSDEHLIQILNPLNFQKQEYVKNIKDSYINKISNEVYKYVVFGSNVTHGNMQGRGKKCV